MSNNQDDSVIINEQEELTTIRLENRKWLHRRRIAYISLFALIASFTMILIGYPVFGWSLEYLQIIINVINWFFIAMVSLVGAYMGLGTWSEIIKNRN